MQRKSLISIVPLVLIILACQQRPTNQSDNNINLSKSSNVSDVSKVESLKIAYVGNMGVCIEHDDKTVLIDGLHEFYKEDYVYPSEEFVNNLIIGKFKDFTSIEFCLFTHLHGDHFSGRYSKQYLDKNKDGTVIGSYQIKEGILNILGETDSIAAMVKVIPYDKQAHSIEGSGITITSIQCDHANPKRHNKTQNIAYLVTIEGFKILHVGDTDWDATYEPLKTLDILESNLDIAILPYWMLLEDDSATKVHQIMSPSHIIATHIPPNFKNIYKNQLLQNFSNISLFTTLEDVQYFENK